MSINKFKVLSLRGKVPIIHVTAYIHPTATLIGDVQIGENCFVGPNVVMRADNGSIVMKEHSNLQDNCVVHSSEGHNVHIASFARIGHNAVLHGCTIDSWAVIGIGSTVMDGATVCEYSIVGGSSFVKAHSTIPAKCLAIGIPAIYKKSLTEEQIASSMKVTREYVELPKTYKESGVEVEPIYVGEPA